MLPRPRSTKQAIIADESLVQVAIIHNVVVNHCTVLKWRKIHIWCAYFTTNPDSSDLIQPGIKVGEVWCQRKVSYVEII